ncbi:hypothetical protein CVS40_11287 [Lucilia cuprina]|nr:hypothetical protein CVS40_11287 [Lucilia cuprina]
MLHRNVPTSEDSNGSSRTSNSGPSTKAQAAISIPTVSSQVATSNSSSTTATINRQAFYTSQNQTVLLGTAIVNIHHQGMTYPARALIDPASETSFISERVQNRLKILTQSTNA